MTDFVGGRMVRAGLAATTSVLAFTLATSAIAQTVDIGPPQVPLNDTDCDFDNPTAPRQVPPCTVNGTRTVTYNGRTREVRTPTADTLIDRYQVDFAGTLAIDGQPVATGPNPIFPFNGAGSRDARTFFFDDLERQNVSISATYTGERLQSVATGGAGAAAQSNPAYFSRVSNLATTVNSIDIDIIQAFAETSDGNQYDFWLQSVDPTAIVNNGTALSGYFRSDDDNRNIQYGLLSGTATVTGGYRTTPYPADVDASNTGLLSLYQLVYDVTATVTTQLDETGLIAPRVTVSDGIEMNGSRVTGLAAGIAASDAVNVAQLNAVGASASAAQATADQALARTAYIAVNGSGAAPTAGGANAIAIGTNANAASDNAIAIGTNATATGGAAVSIGLANVATGNGAVAIGDPNLATGTGAVAIGADNTATGDGAVAIGNLAVANGAGNVALGNGAQANAANSVAIGGGSIATQANTVSVGAQGAERRVTNVASGTAATDAANVGQVAVVVATETTARSAADTQIVAALNTEVTTRQQVDLQLSQRIATAEAATSAFTANLAAEQAARIDADNATATRLNSLDGRIGNLEARLDGFDDNVASATAVATAMSGNAFLPDMRFNLTANVATYDGAHAGSLQLGALVTRNVALNAGVATGFNRGGKTAARAGVTLGF